MLLYDEWITEDIRKEIKKILRSKQEQRNTISKSLGHYESITQRNIYFMEHIQSKKKKSTNK